MPRFLAYLEACVADGRLGGMDNPNVADFAAISSFMAGKMGGFEPDAGQYPVLSGYIDRFYNSPLIRKRLEAENAYISHMTAAAAG